MLHSFLLQIAIRWGAAFISFSAVACIFYAFIGIFPLFKKSTLKLILTACFIIICIFIYHEFNKPTTVRMKEDVMYILPKSDTTNKK
jgi:apolipoprotein N-acyltransferase